MANIVLSNSSGSATTLFVSDLTVDDYGRVTGVETSSVSFTGYAPLANAALTGTPTAPTANAGTNSTQIATTAFVNTEVTSSANTLQSSISTKISSNTVTARGDLLTGDANGNVTVQVLGTNGTYLKANSSAPTGIEWASIPTINALDDIGDVTITSISDGDLIKWSNSSNAWVNVTFGIDTVSDVTISNASSGESLVYNGSVWVNKIVALGNETSGDYVANLTAGTGISLANNSGEGSSPSVSIGQDVANTASVTFANVTITSAPTASSHAATKEYVDEVAQGLQAKPAVEAATTANLVGTYDNGTDGVGATLTATSNEAFPTIDGVSGWAQYDGILLKNQTNKEENGRWVVTTVGDGSNPWVLTRCGLCDEADEIPGAYIFVKAGTTNANNGYVLSVANPSTFVVGTDDIDVIQFSGAGQITAGTGLTKNGNELSVSNVVVTTSDTGTVTNAMLAGSIEQGKILDTSINAQSASYTLVLSDKDKLVEMGLSGAGTLTVPADDSVNFPTGATITVLQTTANQITLTPGSGVTINGTPGLKLRAQWSSATLIKRAANTWVALGDLAA